MIIVFTGNGKGKTTAALGQALRAVGDGNKVLMVQFIKGPWKSGEDISQKYLSPYFHIVKKGKGFVGIGHDQHPFETHVQAAVDGLHYAIEQAKTDTWNVIILDEIWNALELQLLSSQDIDRALAEIIPHVDHLILTGRGCPQAFIDKADLVTEMREIKHPFSQGTYGTQGVEY
ncbi:MAG: Cob(I)alamin adenosyltransferase (modular protein) [Candidatus Paceibacter sp.]|jgi:cob(I)alamin adenosyltransferase|nr:Cob(I)alamin adenosyltransferase (modular protein) [Candidatus Paceibacter sp.]